MNKKAYRILMILSVLSFVAECALFFKLPAQIPLQWGSNGEVTKYGPRYMALF